MFSRGRTRPVKDNDWVNHLANMEMPPVVIVMILVILGCFGYVIFSAIFDREDVQIVQTKYTIITDNTLYKTDEYISEGNCIKFVPHNYTFDSVMVCGNMDIMTKKGVN
jgi:hypothetical protein